MPIRERWDRQVAYLQDKYGRRRVRMLAILAIAGLTSVVIQLLMYFQFGHSAMLYIAVPYCVAILITLLRPYDEPESWWQEYMSHSLSALVVFFASSVILLEGFICVLIFMPIYFFIVTFAIAATWISRKADSRAAKTRATALPLLVAILSLEGTSEGVTFDRESVASAKATTSLTAAAIMQNLETPFDLPDSDHWMLGLFPMPVAIEAGSLNEGDVHVVHMRYHRWFFTNTHEGQLALRIDSVSPQRIAVSFVEDTSYLSTYVRLIGSEILITTVDDNNTQVSLAITYERRLDPAWYFRPIQQHAIEAMAEHLIAEVLTRE